MPTSYTSNLKLALPATGELSGTWGDVVNQNITSMIEEAITAKATVSSWSSNAASITTANGISSAGRALYLDLTGTLTATGTLTLPTANKFYIVRNGTTGGFDVTVKMASGATVSVSNGATTMVYTDGTNTTGVLGSYATLAGAETLTNKTLTAPAINGTVTTTGLTLPALTLGGAITGNSQNITGLTTLDATNVEVTNLKAADGTAAGSIANTTGVVTLNSSVLTTADINGGTIDGATIGGAAAAAGSFTTLTTSSTVTHNGGTANGVAYLNGSKVVTTGSALTFDGTNLGIGGAPSFIIHTKQAESTYHVVERTTAGSEGILYIGATSSSNQIISQGASSAAKALTFQIGSAESMRLDSSGNLGLGVTPSASSLATIQSQWGLLTGNQEINAAQNAYFNGGWKYVQTAVTAARYSQVSGTHQWFTAPSGTAGNAISFTQAMTLDASGNLVVGGTSALGGGKISLSVDLSAVNGFVSKNSAASYGGTNLFFRAINSSAASVGGLTHTAAQDMGVWGYTNLILSTGSGGAERARIDSSGNLGLGVTPTYFLDMLSSGNGPCRAHLRNASSGTSASAYYTLGNDSGASVGGLILGSTTNSIYGANTLAVYNSANAPITFWTNNAEKMRLDSSGNLGLGVTPSAWSGAVPNVLQVGTGASVYSTNVGQFSAQANTYYSGGFKYIGTGYATQYQQDSGKHTWFTAPSGTAGNAISFTQAMTLDASGNLLVGTTTANGKLYVNGLANSVCARFEGAATTGALVQCINTNTSGSNTAIFFQQNGTAAGSITTSNTTTTYNTSSDYRLKNITGPITTSGAYIDSLNPVEGTWKADGSTFVGLLAHEVQEASRTNVATGVKDGPEMQAMDYSSAEIIANLIAEVKSLRARVAALESD